jgi:hypothetical protein
VDTDFFYPLKDKLQGMKNEAGDHQTRIERVMQSVTESEGLDQQSIRQNAEETSQKASQMMQTYLGEDPDTLDALESSVWQKVEKLHTMKS